MSNNTLPPDATVAQQVEWYKAELGTWDNLDKAWNPQFKDEFKRLSGAAIQTIILGSGLQLGPWPSADAFGMAGAYQRLITTEQLSAMDAFMIKIIHPSVILSTNLDVSKLDAEHTHKLVSNGLDSSLAADDPRASWVSKITASQVSAINSPDSSGHPHDLLYRFWTNGKNLSTDPAVALPYLTSLKEKLQAIGGWAIASAMGYDFENVENNSKINPLVSQFLTTKQINESFSYFGDTSREIREWLDQNFKDIATLKRKDVVIQDLSAGVVNAMAVELDRTSRVNGEFGYWVWELSDQQIKGLSKEAGFALFKAWVDDNWLDETYSPNQVVNDTLARQFKNFSSDVVEAIIQTKFQPTSIPVRSFEIQPKFGLAARYQWLLSAEQLNRLSYNSLDQIFGTIANRTDLTSGLSQRVVNDMAKILDERGQVNGKLGYWVWTLSDQQIKGLSSEAGLALFKAWASHNWLDETYSPNGVVNDTLARQVQNFSGGVIDAIISDFGLAGRYQWLLSADQVKQMSLYSRKAIAPTIRSKFKEDDFPWGLWMGIGGPPKLVKDANVDQMSLNQPTIYADLLIQRMASATNVPSANTNVFNPNAPMGASSSNQALVAVH